MKSRVLCALTLMAFGYWPARSIACDYMGVGYTHTFARCQNCVSEIGSNCTCAYAEPSKLCAHLQHKTCLNADRGWTQAQGGCDVYRCVTFCAWLSSCHLVSDPTKIGPCVNDADCTIDPFSIELGSANYYIAICD